MIETILLVAILLGVILNLVLQSVYGNTTKKATIIVRGNTGPTGQKGNPGATGAGGGGGGATGSQGAQGPTGPTGASSSGGSVSPIYQLQLFANDNFTGGNPVTNLIPFTVELNTGFSGVGAEGSPWTGNVPLPVNGTYLMYYFIQVFNPSASAITYQLSSTLENTSTVSSGTIEAFSTGNITASVFASASATPASLSIETNPSSGVLQYRRWHLTYLHP